MFIKPIQNILAAFLVIWLFPLLSAGERLESPTRDKPLIVLEDQKKILIAGYVQASEYNKTPFFRRGHTKNWHGVVWEGGSVKISDVLFVSRAKDIDVYDALIHLSAVPGNNLTTDAWEKRGDPKHPGPNTRVEGTPMEVSVTWKGAAREYSLAELVEDPGGKGLSLKFGGNRELIPVWKSGCIVCLYSCPGGKVSNASYTANDYVFKTTRFSAREDLLPADGTEVTITISFD